MLSVAKSLDSASMGNPRRLYPMLAWTVLESLLRGLPYGVSVGVIWEIIKPLQNPSLSLNVSLLNWYTAMLGIVTIALYFVSSKTYDATYEEGYRLCGEGRRKIVDHLQKLPMGFYNSRDPGDIGAYIVSDYDNIEQLVTHQAPGFFSSFIFPFVILACFFFFNWKMALISIVVLPLAYPFTRIAQCLIDYFGQTHKKTGVQCSARMVEYVQGIRLIKAFNLGGIKFEKLESAFRNFMDASIKVEAGAGPVIIFASAVLNFGCILLMYYGIDMVIDGSLSLLNYVMFIVIGWRIYEPLTHSLIFLGESIYMGLGVQRTQDLLSTPLLTEGDTNNKIDNFRVEFRNVSFSYNNVQVIDNLSAVFPEKKLIALVGPSGSGKTTLTRLIARFWDIQSGTILIGGKDIKSYTTKELLSKISMVFQDVYLFNDTIYNNIKIGKETATRDEIINAARAARCHEFIMNSANGYETMVGEGGCTLSGGEKQRISIARAILKNAPIVLLDEATASLDPENEHYIQQAINDLVKNKTVIVIAHRLHTISRAHKIIVIDHGKVAEEGTHEQLLENHGIYAQNWSEQVRAKEWKF